MRSHKTLRFCPLPNVSITLTGYRSTFHGMSVAPQQFSFSRITRELTVTESGKNLVVNKKKKRRDCLMSVLEREWGGKTLKNLNSTLEAITRIDEV